ncbi:hypothetical protein Q7A53_05880 [Halobacillus rhizosphaerae]|uniref:hypothetical protein n=1 Tax=Halobacillus rhizosphaerae TaxID=3064889 RepID=UPI00398B8987
MSEKYYVTMTDNFMSGWGMAEGKINKLVFECESLKEARIVEENANNRDDMKYVKIRSTCPYYNSSKYYTQFKNKDEYPAWYQENYFANN